MICFQISIFEPLKTALSNRMGREYALWFAFKLVSLNHWKQLFYRLPPTGQVVICFQISIFEPLKTAESVLCRKQNQLWFAFKLVSLNHWKQLRVMGQYQVGVVICFQISIFEPLKTAVRKTKRKHYSLWFAFKLVSLNHWKQHAVALPPIKISCDLLSN